MLRKDTPSVRNEYNVVGDVVIVELGGDIQTVLDIKSFHKIVLLDIRWRAHFDYNRYYVYGQSFMKLHRLITEAPDDLVVDHINGDSLDNRLSNLRVCTQQENGMNRTSLNINNTSGVRGVSFHKASNKWRATVRVHRLQHHLGLFTNKQEAEIAVTAFRESI